MKILFVLDNGRIGGAEKLMLNLAEKIPLRGHEVAILILGKDKSITAFSNKDIVFLFAARRFKLDIFRFTDVIGARIKEYQPHVVVTNGFLSYLFTARALKAIKLKIPKFLIFHTISPFSFRDRVFDFFYLFVLHIFGGQWVILYPEQAKNIMRRFFLKRKDIKLMRSGVDTAVYAKTSNIPTAVHGYEKNIFTIAHIASLKPIKNQEALFHGLSIFNTREKVEWQMFIAGQGEARIREEYGKKLKRLGIYERVKFLGVLKDVRELLNVSDVFVLTSLTEAFPLSALEALSMGVPCILPHVGGCASIVEEGGNGYLIHPKNPVYLARLLGNLYRDKTRLDSLKEYARKTAVERFSLDHTVDDLLDLCIKNEAI
ncbi:MAG: glycosyltransferase family 4 protein [Candidatus Omnitrophota bacterium]